MRELLLKRSLLIALLAVVSFAQPALAQKTKAQLSTQVSISAVRPDASRLALELTAR
jgi:hypothetical protein